MANVSVKHAKISKDQTRILVVIAIAVAVIIFGLFASKAMISKGLYQRKALHQTREVAALLKSNYASAQTLLTQYQVFEAQNPNMLGGSTTGTANLDGNNPKITLDALPSTYDAPALASSLEKILTERAVKINSVTLTDDPTANSDKPEAKPAPKLVVLSFEGTTTFSNGGLLIKDFERSIRPFDINTLEITGTDNNLKINAGMTTYFQSAKSLDLTATKEIK
ncbi:hypothetical protein KW803_02465 [Candidatus Saccharibacteria bacterium]|nr:hypothetical protein [Candidatus Saccharibacteria bacterium]